jgi:hypothetical protein
VEESDTKITELIKKEKNKVNQNMGTLLFNSDLFVFKKP